MESAKELFDLTGQAALVTGGSRGLGKQIAEGLAECGAAVFLVARREEWLQPTLGEFAERGFRCEGMVCDAAQPEQVAAAVRRTVEAFGEIDILVNNAGISWSAPAEQMALEKWREVLDVNLTGTFLFCQEAARRMIERGRGAIINVASINALQGGLVMRSVSNAGYVASKGAVVALTRELGAKWAVHGIRVNAIAPGYFRTRMTERIWERAEAMAPDRIPMGRGGSDQELKGVAVFLASRASSYVTGQTIVVDGGTTLI